MRYATLLAVLALAPGIARAQEETPAPDAAQAAPPAAHPEAENSGQDPTRPVARFDTRIQYSDLPSGFDQTTLTFRVDKPFSLGGGWKLNTRIDLPMSVSDLPGPDNAAGHQAFGLDDVLVQGLLIRPLDKLWALAAGAQLILPTGTPRQFTGGKWKLVPSLAVVRQLPSLSPGSFAGLLVRDSFSFAGPSSFADSNVMSVQPIFNVQLPKRWFVTFSPEIKFDTRDDWKASVPFDMTVGTKLSDRVVISLQGDVVLIGTYQTYDWKTEFRVGFFF